MVDQYDNQEARGTVNSIAKYGPSTRAASAGQRMNRLRTGWKGRGDYKSFFSQFVPRGTFAWAGRELGGMTGVPGATALGAWAGNKLSNAVGFGDYGGEAGGNQLMGGSIETPLQVNQSNDLTGDIVIQHREFLGNVTATGGTGNITPFVNVPYNINPGLVDSLPWLSQIAQNYELYEFQGLIFEFKPTSGELGATGTNSLGKIVMATNYDPDATLFTSSVQMENYDYSNSCKPSEHMIHGVETAPKQRATQLLYVRTGISTKDKVLTDLGIFQIATEGLPITNGTTANVGELWVTYACKLSRAQLFGSLGGLNVSQDSFYAYSATGNIMNGTTANLPTTAWANRYTVAVYDAAAARVSNTIGGTLTSGSATGFVYSFPANIVSGTYRIRSYIIQPTLAAATFSTSPTFANCALASPVGEVTAFNQNVITIPATATAAAFLIELYVTVTAPGSLVAAVGFSFTSQSAGAITIFDIAQYPSSFLP